MKKRWKLLTSNEQQTKALHEALKINYTLCKILVQRGFDDFDKAKSF